MSLLRRLCAALAAAVVLCLLSAVQAVDFDYCNGHRKYPVKVNAVNIIPEPIVRGQLTTFQLNLTTDETLAKGKLDISVKYIWFTVDSETHELCEETSCPAVGTFMVEHKQTLPIITPPGSYTVTMKLLGDKNAELTCLSFSFNIGFLASAAYIAT